MLRVRHFRMKLHAIIPLIRIGNGGACTMLGMRDRNKTIGQSGYSVVMIHPNYILLRQPFKQGRGEIEHSVRRAIFTRIHRANLTTQHMRHPLLPIADAKHRNTKGKHNGIACLCMLVVDALRAARQDDAFKIIVFPCIHCSIAGKDLTIHTGFADTAHNQLVVLTAEIQHNDFFHQSWPPSLSDKAAPINSRNSGCGRIGRERNSGWNCTPTNQG